METEVVRAWHFPRMDKSGAPILRDGRPLPPVGEWLEEYSPPILCVRGLHASENILHALLYAHGPVVCRVECAGTIMKGHGKLVATKRRIVWSASVEDDLDVFARWVATRCLLYWPIGYGPTGKRMKLVVDYLRDGGTITEKCAAWEAVIEYVWQHWVAGVVCEALSLSEYTWRRAAYTVSSASKNLFPLGGPTWDEYNETLEAMVEHVHHEDETRGAEVAGGE